LSKRAGVADPGYTNAYYALVVGCEQLPANHANDREFCSGQNQPFRKVPSFALHAGFSSVCDSRLFA
jgi:hypothetical protein